tara:strand:+ start:129 stop:554 length:426 start_codon:yes stop_codon:yes gene_type:complete
MASTLKINTLTGVTTAGSIAVTAEGNSTTTNLQQGLAKAWVNFDGGSVTSSADLTGVQDSFNMTSVVDSGTGNHEITVTNVFTTDGFSSTSSCSGDSSNDNRSVCTDNEGTSGVSVNPHVCTSGSGSDVAEVHVTIHGDLA